MGIKKALLIGINYTGSESELSGCVNDTENLKDFLISKKYFTKDELTLMGDFKTDSLIPTKANILNQFQELVKFADEHKDQKIEMFLSYSGHGTSLRDYNGDEEDGKDEALCPIDYDINGFIVDDDIKSELVDKLHSNVSLFVMIDACHSGTMCDLKYDHKVNKFLTYSNHTSIKETDCNIIMISGCKDTQTSADAHLYDDNDRKYEYQGAMSASFIKCYKDGITYEKLINGMRKWLKSNKFTQIPQLSSGKMIDIRKPCLLSSFDNQ